ncbi:phenylalanine--tRNA ligase subunit beta [Metamycoplasma auris]|uniref:Phenylalanine--tRNA ligase beta subunit n=1 Tax=Metamycoplasma auris TaxID=51363 RepID=A0A2W7G1W9_9BACT|nr:phenylalanine--tRNA ligase subunit beta [Metamycoplasma auris]PZV99933.1 phenylalanyl-tRNA synthetase beta subunit [Metamycoplasma auris]
MIFSYKNLCRLANLKNVTIEQVVEGINSIGFEVEEYHKFADVEGIQLCHVLKVYKNPAADRLSVCEVEYADGHKAIIQTTATNMKEDQYVMSFVPGSRSKNLIFAPRKMQGIVSEGMFVGLSEIGFDEEVIPETLKNQIFQLDKIDLSIDPIEYFDLDDWIIDVSILSNRADAQSYLVMAKELSAYFNTEIKWPKKPNHNLISNFIVGNLKHTNAFSLIEASNFNLNCSLNEKMLLWKHGIKSFNNAVDLTNLVLLYCGVPCHIYNKDDLESNDFSVGYYSGKLNILGNKEVDLKSGLCVFNGSNPISIAATIGLESYQYNNLSQKVIFELASFNTNDIRKNSKQIKLATASSQRASKDISNELLILAYNFLSSYLTDFSMQINAPRVHKKSILLDKSYINRMAGFNICKTKKFDEVIAKLEKLDFKFKSDFSAVTFPNYRYDLDTIQDFVEEVFRFYGYDNFPKKQPKITRLNYEKSNTFDYIQTLVQKNYTNVITYTLIKPENNIFNPFDIKETLNAIDAKNYDHSQIRFSMIDSLNQILLHNSKQGFEKGSYFDIGMVGRETNVLGLISNNKEFNEIKEDLISLTNRKLTFKSTNKDIFNPNVATEIFLDDELVGYIAKIHPKFNMEDAFFAELKLNMLSNKKIEYKNYKHDPIKTRDITVSLSKYESVQDIVNKIESIKGIHSYQIIDIYSKDDNIKNVTFSFKVEDWAIKKLEETFRV